MSLKKKIVLSFLLSAFIIALLSAFLYLNFVEIKKETVFLELADTIRSRSLQLRRHEKNFLLYVSNQQAEVGAIHETLDELEQIVAGIPADRSTPVPRLRGAARRVPRALRRDRGAVRRSAARIRGPQARPRLRPRAAAWWKPTSWTSPSRAVRYLQESLGLHGRRAVHRRAARTRGADRRPAQKRGEHPRGDRGDRQGRPRARRTIHRRLAHRHPGRLPPLHRGRLRHPALHHAAASCGACGC